MVHTLRHIQHRYVPWAVCLFVLLILSLVAGAGRPARAQEGWSAPVMVSDPLAMARLPDLAVDERGVIHLMWTQIVQGPKEELDQVCYSTGSELGWSVPNDIVPPRTSIAHVAVAADLAGGIHLLFTGSAVDSSVLYHQRAAVDKAWSALSWSRPHLLNQGDSSMGDIAVDSAGVIHIVYNDAVSYSKEEDPMTGVFYRRSIDGGASWSLPANLHASPTGDLIQPSIDIDRLGVIHVTWSEYQADLARSGVYVLSTDGGSTWGPYTAVVYPELTIAQLTAGSNESGGVMLVWRTISRDEIFYQWSTDQGQSWDAPATIPEIWARPWELEMDVYDMAADSAGQIHLLLVGRRSLQGDALLGLYHLVWDGTRWSYPVPVFESSERYPEYPQLVIYEGNRLHGTWFTRERSLWDQAVTRQVWYAAGQALAPHQPVVPLPTPVPVQVTVAPTPASTLTPQRTWDGEGKGLPEGLYTDNDDVLWMAVALAPIALILLILVVVRSGWFQKLWW